MEGSPRGFRHGKTKHDHTTSSMTACGHPTTMMAARQKLAIQSPPSYEQRSILHIVFLLVLFTKITSSCLKISIMRYSNYGCAHVIVTSSCLLIENMDFLFMVVTRNWFYILLTKHILVSWMLFSIRKYSQGREILLLSYFDFLPFKKKNELTVHLHTRNCVVVYWRVILYNKKYFPQQILF
jgi:hypothetical protein